jgi:hypothetical protein
MRRATALLLGVLLPLLGLSEIGQAQSSVQVQGTIQAVDCQAQTLVLSGPGTTNTIATASYTAILVNSTSIPFCDLTQYLGAPATAWLLASGNEFIATRVDVVGAVAAAPAPAVVADPLPIAGIVLGTIVVAGLVYLLVRHHDGQYYRYPYYGSYYHHYYQPFYRPYFGPYPALAPVIYVPPVIAGIVLGTIFVASLEYLLVRDHYGGYSRYPYYGPYRNHYYRQEFQPYHGSYRDYRGAPLREGDHHWSPPAYRGGPDRGGPGFRDSGNQWNQGHQGQHGQSDQGVAPRWTPPANQVPPGYQNGNQGNHGNQGNQGQPGQGVTPRWTPPANQAPPGYQNGNQGNHGNQGQQGQRNQRCEGTASNQSCGGSNR